MSAFLQDLKYGIRLLFRHRGFTIVAALVLALGIGANTAVFTLINTMVLKARPGVPDAELAGVYSRDRTQPDAYRAFSYWLPLPLGLLGMFLAPRTAAQEP